MKLKKIILLILALLTALSPSALCAAQQEIVEGIYAYACNGQSMQDWIDKSIAPMAGSSADNYIINLNRSKHGLNLSKFVQAAAAKLQAGEISNPVSGMRCALALITSGAGEYVPEGFADNCIGKLGIMSYAYGLHLLNNGGESQQWTVQTIAEKIISMQKADGGWAVMGDYGDVDVTAMCLQALAASGFTDAYQKEIEAGVEFLSQRQMENGGFSSNGRENSESAAQVIIALSSLGVDAQADERFIKNGNSPLDALLCYRLPSGGFAHLPGDAANETACIQALQALTALKQPGVPYFSFDTEAIVLQKTSPIVGWKMYALIAIAVLTLAGVVFALTRKHGRMKQLAFVLLAAGIAAAAVLLINVESASDYYRADGNKAADGSVTLSIRCDTVAGRAQDESTPEDGVILERTAMPFAEGDTVFDILTDAARSFEIHMEHEGGTGDLAYVSGINYLYEYTYGDLSGWVFDVNGQRPSVGCGAYILADGDEIIWQYTLNLGEDVK